MKVIMEFDLSDPEKGDELRLKQVMKAKDLLSALWDIREYFLKLDAGGQITVDILDIIESQGIDLEELYP
jgi:hypothetical protein